MKPLVKTYSPQEVADQLGMSKATILAAVNAGELPAIRPNQRVIRITATDAALWYASIGGRLKPTTPATLPTLTDG